VVFDPPHPAARFAAYKNLADGVQAWVGYYQSRVMPKSPTILASLNSGDASAVARDLKKAGYYTGDEAAYASGIAVRRPAVDLAMGWSP
jgi:hypothetical protein